jgi:hypothetical protein
VGPGAPASAAAADLLLELLRAALGDQASAVEDRHPVGELVGVLEVLRSEEHGWPASSHSRKASSRQENTGSGPAGMRSADRVLAGGRPQSYISVCTCGMKIVRCVASATANVILIPRELEASGYTPGASVLVEQLAGGELRIIPTDQVRERIRQTARRVVAEHPEALEILANQDPDVPTRAA